jgi:hypothetical protein
MFRLDRNGGRDKIVKASYSPKGYRHENRKRARLSTSKLVLAWIVIFSVIFGLAYLAEKYSITSNIISTQAK